MATEYKSIFLFLVLVHIVGDFYFQSEIMATKKEDSLKWVGIHSLIYGFVWIFFVKTVFINFSNIYLMVLIVSHFLIDVLKFYRTKIKFLRQYKINVFVVDQILHLFVLLCIVYFMMRKGEQYRYNSMLVSGLNMMGISFLKANTFILQLLLIHKPTNILIVSIMKEYKPNVESEENDVRAGRMIGTLERIIMLFFLSLKQYSSIGLVLTAKSIARYNKISEDKRFAEYYLLGTLLSTISVLIVSLI